MPLESAVRVVPAVPTMAVDGGFWYAIPPGLDPALGQVVRVPLGGRRVRGWVVERAARDPVGLRPVVAIVGRSTVFDRPLLDTLAWAAHHYVAPLAVVLERVMPPNLAPGEVPAPPPFTGRVPSGALAGVGAGAVAGRRRTTVWLDGSDPGEWLGDLAVPVLAAARSMLVVLGTAEEVVRATERLRPVLGGQVVAVHPGLDSRALTAAWAQARHRGGVVVGTPRAAAWPVAGLALAVVGEEGRRAMKDRQTPTIHVRDFLRARAARSRHSLLFAGPTPSVEVLAGGPEILRAPGRRRVWALVEVVDRAGQAPGSGLLTEPARQAIRAVVRGGGRVFVFAHRRGYAAAARCGACRTLRRCPTCGSRPDPGPECRRCGAALGACRACGATRFEPLGAGVERVREEVARVVGREVVALHPGPAPVTVGSERDLTTLEPCDLAVVVDLDGLVFGTNYRSAEEALRVGARLAGRVRGGSGRRMIVQTSAPDHPVVTALRRGDPLEFGAAEIAVRGSFGYPPAGELVVVEMRGGAVAGADGELRAAAAGAAVLGPATTPAGLRWLVQGRDLAPFREAARPLVQRWRDAGATVRIDVDPIDL